MSETTLPNCGHAGGPCIRDLHPLDANASGWCVGCPKIVRDPYHGLGGRNSPEDVRFDDPTGGGVAAHEKSSD